MGVLRLQIIHHSLSLVGTTLESAVWEVFLFCCCLFLTGFISLVFRCDCIGDLCDCVSAGNNGQVPLQEKRDISEPGGEGSST